MSVMNELSASIAAMRSLTRATTRRGSSSVSANSRTALLIRAIISAAGMPFPATSPTTIASEPPSSGMKS